MEAADRFKVAGQAGLVFAVCLAGLGYWLGVLKGLLPASACIIAGAMMVTKRQWGAGFAAVIVIMALSMAGQVLPPLPF
ncbi:putative membrane protein [Cupriavidus metallidurans]|jgi:hypothetical protein|uniref:hypothetical protein n=1 Tax=Cupriavidus TaxID=106589 RepID=UPI0004932A62|nr:MULTISPECIES: hypothetical protein [Cupriavidus]AVA38104.1 hypothetical protein C3Z06_31375 [Cupriavidus metallidurans]MCA3184278.1 hypothetical protein [Cupriavidus sp.]MCA3188639.1 hypothetical protein [Cupriavidus sp.]MCA3234710.1 hypothetical protein [Cupriavidus sp.]MDE4922648.1 hypothetical protein [Cupriavidus metallidurans]